MPRSTSSVTHRARTKKLFKQTKGYIGQRSHILSVAKQSLHRSGMYAFAHRRKKKGDYRTLWNIRINAALKSAGLFSYSRLIHYLACANIKLDRKVLAFLAVNDAEGFKQVALEAQQAAGKADTNTVAATSTDKTDKTQKEVTPA